MRKFQVPGVCAVEGCVKPPDSRKTDYCNRHRKQMARAGVTWEPGQVVCAQCNRSFRTSRRAARFCSDKCRALAAYRASKTSEV